MSAPIAEGSTSSTPTISQTLQSLLQSHRSRSYHASPEASSDISKAYLHPYSPNPMLSITTANRKHKGKERARLESPLGNSAQLESLRRIRESLEGIIGVVESSAFEASVPAASAGGGGGGGDLGRKRDIGNKLIRSLRDVANHQAYLLPLQNAISTLPTTTTTTTTTTKHGCIPSDLILLTPVQLLTTLAKQLGIQTYLEESQFGLLKTSLALAGNRFVVDVDLEIGSSSGNDVGNEEDEDEDDKMEGQGDEGTQQPVSASNSTDKAVTQSMTTAPVTTPPATTRTTTAPATHTDREDGGIVKLSKLTANHVTLSGATGASSWISSALRNRLEQYLAVWNDGSYLGGGRSRDQELQKMVDGLKFELRELKAIDEISLGVLVDGPAVEKAMDKVLEESVDWFAELEVIAARLHRHDDVGYGDFAKLYPSSPPSVIPTFTLLPFPPTVQIVKQTSTLGSEPRFRIRPSYIYEELPPLPRLLTGGMVTDHQSEGSPSPSLVGNWILEYVSPHPNRYGREGLPVFRSWLSSSTSASRSDRSANSPQLHSKTDQWDGLVKLEQLIYASVGNQKQGWSYIPDLNSKSTQSGFPYYSDFVHLPKVKPTSETETTTLTTSALSQHWSISQPGPEGYVVGRLPISSLEDLDRVVSALKRQAMLNGLFSTIFHPASLNPADDSNGVEDNDHGPIDEDDDNDDGMEDLFAPRKAIPISASLTVSSSIFITFPLPDQSVSLTAGSPMYIDLDILPDPKTETLDITWSLRSLSGGSGDDISTNLRQSLDSTVESLRSTLDLVEIVSRIDQTVQLSLQ